MAADTFEWDICTEILEAVKAEQESWDSDLISVFDTIQRQDYILDYLSSLIVTPDVAEGDQKSLSSDQHLYDVLLSAILTAQIGASTGEYSHAPIANPVRNFCDYIDTHPRLEGGNDGLGFIDVIRRRYNQVSLPEKNIVQCTIILGVKIS